MTQERTRVIFFRDPPAADLARAIGFGSRVWTISAAIMERRRDHQVPLSQQVLDVLAAVQAINSNRHYVFATYEDNPIIAKKRRIRNKGKFTHIQIMHQNA